MAKTAAIVLTPSTAAAQQVVTAVCTATNGDTDSYVIAVRPYCYPTGLTPAAGCASAVSSVPVNLTSANGLAVLGSNGTATVSFNPVVFVPQGSSAANQTWVVGCDLYWATGEVTTSSTANLTVTHQP
jgi:hypothetical protein